MPTLLPIIVEPDIPSLLPGKGVALNVGLSNI